MGTLIERVDAAAANRTLALRDEADRVLRLASHLRRRDRALIEHIYGQGNTLADLSRLSGVPPRTLQYRHTRILRRLNSPTFRYVAVHVDTLPKALQAVARYAVLEGRSQRDTARLSGRSLHAVRQASLRLHTLVEARMTVNPMYR